MNFSSEHVKGNFSQNNELEISIAVPYLKNAEEHLF